MERVSADTLARIRDADLLGLEESVRVYEWLEPHKGEPEARATCEWFSPLREYPPYRPALPPNVR